ncbi:MAG: hypothetical protein IJ774_07740 [Selenomonadaceae bacterium]|nr:hypothetical protein [Selenomonadaceae bacterium]
MKKFFVTLFLVAAIAISSTARAAEFEMVEYSAQVKLQWLAAAGIPQAQKFLKEIDRPVFFTADNLPDFARLQNVNALYQELNFAAAINYVRENNYSNVMDLACSLSPRAMILGDEGRSVIVGELNTVCLIGDWMVDEFGAQSKKTVDYQVIPIEDAYAMTSNADKLSGEICIIEQGLLIYLNDLQRAQMFDNIHAILKKHGGCFITSDFNQKKYFTDVAAALYGADAAPTLYAETKAMYEKVLDDKIADEVLQDERTAIDFLAQHGLKAEKVPLFSTTPGLYCAKNFTAAQIAAVNAVAAKKYLWVITSAD